MSDRSLKLSDKIPNGIQVLAIPSMTGRELLDALHKAVSAFVIRRLTYGLCMAG
jgi:hypothetical protein